MLVVVTARLLALASSPLMSVTNCVVSSTSVSRLSFCASAAFASASAFFSSAWLQPVVANAPTTNKVQAYFRMRTSPLGDCWVPLHGRQRLPTNPHESPRPNADGCAGQREPYSGMQT